ncbi:MAG TPA: hypothetical protein VFA92_13445 [Candidatus Binatia bacterium]|jgi:hypothetical protein|nr:hypothetical protein [Candidatus Binatia bacterium]
MRGTASNLGVAGGIVGFIAAIFEFYIDALGQATRPDAATTVTGLTWLAFVAATLGISGGALALRKPRVAAALLLASCAGGFVAASTFWVVAGVLLFVGALLCFVELFAESRPRRHRLADGQPPRLRLI